MRDNAFCLMTAENHRDISVWHHQRTSSFYRCQRWIIYTYQLIPQVISTVPSLDGLPIRLQIEHGNDNISQIAFFSVIRTITNTNAYGNSVSCKGATCWGKRDLNCRIIIVGYKENINPLIHEYQISKSLEWIVEVHFPAISLGYPLINQNNSTIFP